MASSNQPTQTLNQSFPLFARLPIEIRLSIWHLTLTPRVIELQLLSLTSNDLYATSDLLYKTPLTRPRLHPLFHVNRETRSEAFAIYRPLSAQPNGVFMSSHEHPFDLTSHSLDTYIFLLPLYYLQQQQSDPAVMFSASAAQAMGLTREFVLDRLATANDGLDVSKIESMGIMWSDMHIKNPSTLIKALQPFASLRHLFICFVEQTVEGELFRKGNRVGGLMMSLVHREGSQIRSRFLFRMLDEYEELAKRMNVAFAEVGISTKLGIRMVRLEK
ncbi:hypothetical protein VF21_06996 [Pseudogymnoascus sp. 05NY08]|nr:hypothetical protein VF21_06996 [Pseudogymnoascus sp. 05NY08]